MLVTMDEQGNIPAAAKEAHVHTIYDRWQLPMYNLEVTLNVRPIDELREAQERLLWSEIGDW